jgi:hypothetical protein
MTSALRAKRLLPGCAMAEYKLSRRAEDNLAAIYAYTELNFGAIRPMLTTSV